LRTVVAHIEGMKNLERIWKTKPVCGEEKMRPIENLKAIAAKFDFEGAV